MHCCVLEAMGNTSTLRSLSILCSRYEDAIECFSRCIALNPEDAKYYSNRAAAYQAAKKFQDAATDAHRVTAMMPKWSKGWSRLGAALFALEQFSEVLGPQSLLRVLL